MFYRIYLILESQSSNLMNYNYNYELTKLIYEGLNQVDILYTKQLHETGFEYNKNKKYKLFNFNILFNDVEFTEKGIQIKEKQTIKLCISGKKDLVNNIVKGLIRLNEIKIGENIFKIINKEDDKKVRFKKTILYKVASPIVESVYNSDTNKTEYTNPFQQNYYNALVQNLKRKYYLIYNKEYEGELDFLIDNILKVKEKRIHNIKNNGVIVGYGKFEIWINANKDMQEVAYYLGLGQNNSTGAGNLMYITAKQ